MKFINVRPVIGFLAETNPLPRGKNPIFILGGGSMGPVHKAASLYRSGHASVIAFTSAGGNFGGNVVFGQPEVEEYRDILLKLGVPENVLLFPPSDEGRTTNTLVEAQGAIPFIESWTGRPVRQVVLCSRPVHQRRAWATFRKQHPHVNYVNQPDNDEVVTIELLPRLVQEIDRLQQYAAKGDIEAQEIPAQVLEICEELRKHLAGK